MIYAALKAIHLLSIIVWIGGMVFVQFFLRPAVTSLEAPQRVRLMHEVLGRFFNAVLVAAALVLGSGIWMIGRVAKQTVQSGGNFKMPIEWMVMSVLGVVMVLIFAHIRFALYKRLSRAVTAAAWPAGGAALASIRTWVMVNLAIGVVIVVITQVGLAS
ncbi:MAG: CopD family protein [Rhodoferax sp.]|nr:CopD family protein [Rhodoferax sp.]